jgi:hypothetical protein
MGNIKVIIKDDKQQTITSLISESDGYFSFLGLKSGAYTAQVDSDQLKKLKLESTKAFYNFDIVNAKNGDYMDNLEFTLQSVGENDMLKK